MFCNFFVLNLTDSARCLKICQENFKDIKQLPKFILILTLIILPSVYNFFSEKLVVVLVVRSAAGDYEKCMHFCKR